jgi:D-sedoheptulose 7-phosphate isomerase
VSAPGPGADGLDVAGYLASSAAVAAELAAGPAAGEVVRAAGLVADALAAGRLVMFCGNGGSAGDAQHLAAELVGRYALERRAYRAVALTTDGSVLTAVGNDYGFEHVFERQVQGLAGPGDVLVGITTSGGSRNVVLAAEAARALGCHVVAFLGPAPSPLDALATVALHVPGGTPGLVQQGHITVGQALCGWVEARLAGAGRRGLELG